MTLCKPIDDIVNYPTFICPFQSGKCGKEVEKFKKLNISRRKSSGPTSGYCELNEFSLLKECVEKV